MAVFANVIAVSNKAPNQFFDIVVAIRKGIDNAARNGNADFGLRVTLTYVDTNFNVDTLDSGRLSIKNQTTLLAQIDNRTVSLYSCRLEPTPVPLPTPATARPRRSSIWIRSPEPTSSSARPNRPSLSPC